jgi:hypothetical protein
MGKWVFFPKKGREQDELWTRLYGLYYARELPGVHSMVATTMASESTHELAPGQVHAHCGPYTDQDKVLQVGRQMVERLKYWCQRGHIGYRMGDANGIIYKIEVPK